MRRWAVLAALLTLVAGVAVACGGGGDSADSTTTEAPTEATTEAMTESAPAAGGGGGPSLADDGWSVVPGSILIEEDFVDDFDGTLRVRNGTGSHASGLFTLQVFRGGKRVARMRGFTGGSVEPGSVRTVHLISIHDYVPGPYTFKFQTDRNTPGRQAPGTASGTR